MSNVRVHELAAELDINKHELVETINGLDVGVVVDNPFGALNKTEVMRIKHALGHAPLHGVWRLESLRSRAGDITTGQTHLVVQDEQLWEVWPDQTYYEGDSGPERSYEMIWKDGVGEG